jgi:hypothetical protein
MPASNRPGSSIIYEWHPRCRAMRAEAPNHAPRRGNYRYGTRP